MERTRTAGDRKHTRRLAPDAGVTLIEMMVVIMIIGLITAVVVINVLPNQDTARVQKASVDVQTLEQALELFRIEKARYPTMEEGLEVLAVDEEGGRDRYIRRLPRDPWGEAYQYIIPGQRGPFDLYSLGADGQIGGEGIDADIGNWD
ncbi:type II secretion system protein GspG [bacterium]|nr:type II secretion system protein GspG [bacterium]